MALVINFATVNFNSMYKASSLSVGEVNQAGWSSHTKNNFGDGSFIGGNLTANIITGVADVDVVDAPIIDNDFVPSAQNQQA